MPTKLIIVDGQNGAGKSTVARLLHTKLPHTAFLHFDTVKKIISGYEPSPEYNRIAGEVMRAMAEVYLKNGISVIYEAHFGTAAFVEKVLRLATSSTKSFVYQIEAPFVIRKERIQKGFENGDRKRVLPDEHVLKNDDRYQKEKYQHAKIFDSSSISPEEITASILRDVGV
jgi:predicted kinase